MANHRGACGYFPTKPLHSTARIGAVAKMGRTARRSCDAGLVALGVEHHNVAEVISAALLACEGGACRREFGDLRSDRASRSTMFPGGYPATLIPMYPRLLWDAAFDTGSPPWLDRGCSRATEGWEAMWGKVKRG